MEVSALKYSAGIGLHGRSTLLRLQSDERLVAYLRKGNTAAFEVLVSRYESRLQAFCRHLLGSREDAEDVLQEVLAAAFNAILADDRSINVRPWLYRIARNRSLNHLRRIQAIGVDSMDIHLSENGATTADKVHEREEFRLLVGDIHDLPETQKTALVLREMDALTYEQIAEAMETTVPSVKSLLVRARVSLAEAAEARLLSCEEVRIELGEVAEGLRRRPSPLVRRHLRACERCSTFRTQLKHTNRALAALLPIGPLIVLRKFALLHLSHSAGAGAGSTAAGSSAAGGGAAGAGAAGSSAVLGTTAVAGSASSGFVSAGLGALATKAAAGLAAAALVTAGAVEVDHSARARHLAPHPVALAQLPAGPRPAAAVRLAPAPAPANVVVATSVKPARSLVSSRKRAKPLRVAPVKPTRVSVAAVRPDIVRTAARRSHAVPATPVKAAPLPGHTQTQSDPTVLPPSVPSASELTAVTPTAGPIDAAPINAAGPASAADGAASSGPTPTSPPSGTGPAGGTGTPTGPVAAPPGATPGAPAPNTGSPSTGTGSPAPGAGSPAPLPAPGEGSSAAGASVPASDSSVPGSAPTGGGDPQAASLPIRP